MLNIRSVLPWRWTKGLYLVRAPYGQESENAVVGPGGRRLSCSSFNPKWLEELGIEPRVIIDSVTYDGGNSYRLHRDFPNARVVAIEADPYRARVVRSNLEGTGIEVIECALQDKEGPISWYAAYIDGEPRASGSIYLMTDAEVEHRPQISQPRTPSTVSGRTLNSILKELTIEGVDLLHMDIQGAEYDALVGLGSIRPKVIYLEVGAAYQGAMGPNEVHALLTGFRYRLAADLGTDRLYVI